MFLFGTYEADISAVLFGRRILKIVGKNVFKRCSTSSVEPEVSAIGTKRQHCITSGAEELLDNEDGEEDEEEEDTLTDDLPPLPRVSRKSYLPSLWSRSMGDGALNSSC